MKTLEAKEETEKKVARERERERENEVTSKGNSDIPQQLLGKLMF
jgi:hypothetical protein